MKFRKKPVIIEAELVTTILGLMKSEWKSLPQWVKDNYENGNIIPLNDKLNIRTLEGMMDAGHDDYLIKGVKGEIYPCKKDIFKETYDKIENITQYFEL